MRMFGMCLNWKVLAGLAIVALGIWALAPNVFGAAGPVLLVLACPLSMVFMMRGMRGTRGDQGMSGMQGDSCAMQPDRQAARPLHELRSDVGADGLRLEGVTGAGQATRAEEIAQLKQEMAHIQARQATIARELDELDGAVPQADPATSAVREAQAVAEDAEQRRARAVG